MIKPLKNFLQYFYDILSQYSIIATLILDFIVLSYFYSLKGSDDNYNVRHNCLLC